MNKKTNKLAEHYARIGTPIYGTVQVLATLVKASGVWGEGVGCWYDVCG